MKKRKRKKAGFLGGGVQKGTVEKEKGNRATRMQGYKKKGRLGGGKKKGK